MENSFDGVVNDMRKLEDYVRSNTRLLKNMEINNFRQTKPDSNIEQKVIALHLNPV
jgi:hypothetical protein